MERLGIYGGTFSPPHLGHVSAARAFMAGANLDRLLIFPAAIPPHKQISADDLPAHRLAMAHLAFDGIRGAEVCDWEIVQGGRSYTILTLEHFAAPDRQLVLLTGTDMFLSLDSWYRAADIFALAEIVCIRRESDAGTDEKISRIMIEYREHFGAKIRLLPHDAIVLSSRELRGVAAADGDLTPYLPAAVAEYIRDHHLYVGEQEGTITVEALAALTQSLQQSLSPARMTHTRGVEQTALRLGALYAPNQMYRLRAAALLHDVAKEYPLQKQLNLAKEFGIIIKDDEKRSPALLHGVTAAAMIAHLPEYAAFADPVVIDAVRWHTTGCGEMSLCTEIIFLADYIEPTRTHAACVQLRRAFWAVDPASLDETERLAHLHRFARLEAEQTMRHLIDLGQPIAEDTLRARNSLL